MPRKYEYSEEKEPVKKRSHSALSNDKQGAVLVDLDGKKWKLGKALGIGGFGEIYEATNISIKDKNQSYVAKIEKHSNGPLFVEVNCYLRIAKLQMIDEWKQSHNKYFLGMPHYVASGSHFYNDEKYRFLIIPRYNRDLGKILQEKKMLSLKTVLTISLQILDVLEYIHDKGYVHSDIKASNIMLETNSPSGKNNSGVTEAKAESNKVSRERHCNRIQKRSLRRLPLRSQMQKLRSLSRRILRPIGAVKYIDDIPDLEDILKMHEGKFLGLKPRSENYHNNNSVSKSCDRAYLLDYGLASKYLLANGSHKPFCTDERKAHAGTVLFCSRDAHKGVPTRRSDLESLGYNIIYWLTGELPWIEDLLKPEEIEAKKNRCFRQLKTFLEYCFHDDYPNFLLEYFSYLNNLQFEDSPNYEMCRRIFRTGLSSYGYTNDSKMDFDDINKWTNPSLKKTKKQKNIVLNNCSFLIKSPLKPLSSNIVFKRPKLRKKVKSVQVPDSIMNWSKILTDPENILKQARDRKNTEESEDFTEMDIDALNPTYAMISVYNKAMGIVENSKTSNCSSNNLEGYTPAMMQIYMKMKKSKPIQYTVKFYSSIRTCSRSTRKWMVNCTTPPVLRSSRMLAQY